MDITLFICLRLMHVFQAIFMVHWFNLITDKCVRLSYSKQSMENLRIIQHYLNIIILYVIYMIILKVYLLLKCWCTQIGFIMFFYK